MTSHHPTTGLRRHSPSLRQADPGARRDERGVAAAFVVLFSVALLSVAGLVIDGGYTLAAEREAMNQAEQAARLGADSLSAASLRDGNAHVDVDAATSAAHHYLATLGAHGVVTVHGRDVTVTVTAEQHTTLLTAVGVTSLAVSATATARSIDQDDQ
jgi:Flp pilus assembly protein TadG